MKVQLKLLPKDEVFFGFVFGIHNIVRDIKKYDPSNENYEKAYVLDIGFLLGSIQFTFI